MECLVNALLGGQFCTDSVDIQQNGDSQIGRDILAIIPRLNFSCNGRITSIIAGIAFNNSKSSNPFIQVWRSSSTYSIVYSKTGEVELPSDDQVTRGINNYWEANINLTDNTTIEVQSGDVVGYYHPPDAHYLVKDIQTNGYKLYRFDRLSKANSVNLSESNKTFNSRQPLLQFTIGIQ